MAVLEILRWMCMLACKVTWMRACVRASERASMRACARSCAIALRRRERRCVAGQLGGRVGFHGADAWLRQRTAARPAPQCARARAPRPCLSIYSVCAPCSSAPFVPPVVALARGSLQS
eukprot:3676105-Pleurochrysis_carterae.AAC.5